MAEVKQKMIDMFWVTTRVNHAGNSVTSIRAGDADVFHEIKIENCSGFPADATLVGNLAQPATGIRFLMNSITWTEEAKNIQRNEERTLQRKFETTHVGAGVEPIHTCVKNYRDRIANSDHLPGDPTPLFFNLTIR